MAKSIRSFFTSGSRTVKAYDQSSYPVEISPDGSVSVDSRTLVKSEVAKRHIRAVADIREGMARRKK